LAFLYLKSPPFSFQVNLAPLIHRLNPLVETEQRSVTTDWRVCISNTAHIVPSFRCPEASPATRSESFDFDYPTDGLRWVNSPFTDSFYPYSQVSTQHGVSRGRRDHGFDGENMLWVSNIFILSFFCYYCYYYFDSVSMS
jgi:hypothetical protein